MDSRRSGGKSVQALPKPHDYGILTDPEGSDDESSKQNSTRKVSIEEDLQRFRENWRQEISEKSRPRNKTKTRNLHLDKSLSPKSDILSPSKEPDAVSDSDREKEAIKLFQKGISLEKVGKPYDAVAFYRRATYLVPDIESKIFTFEKNQSKVPQEEKKKKNEVPERTDETSADCYEDLLSKFTCFDLDENSPTCEPAIPTKTAHFSQLPDEIILHILRWVVSSHLDFSSLSRFAAVCKKFYILSRDQEIWRLACLRIWSILSIDQSITSEFNNDWRKMFIEKPKANVNGTYISKASYIRQGDSSFQDVNYRPVYLVEYYRYLRFFPEGIVLMLNTPDEPNKSLGKLRDHESFHPTAIKGHYQIQGTNIIAVLKNKSISNEKIGFGRRAQQIQTATEREYQIILEIRNFKGNLNRQLVWSQYTVTFRRPNGDESTNSFDLNMNKFPPFWFSRVKSYTASSSCPLR